MSKDNKDFSFEIVPNFDFVLEEGSNTSVNLRKISWNGRDPKLDIRKWSYNDGEERMLKGCTLSDEGGNELACVLVEHGYGDTNRLFKALSQRDDFHGTVDVGESKSEEDDSEEEYYDPSMLLS
mgnify:FL=1